MRSVDNQDGIMRREKSVRVVAPPPCIRSEKATNELAHVKTSEAKRGPPVRGGVRVSYVVGEAKDSSGLLCERKPRAPS